jgi:nuclear cap-binding protein subunit 1
MKTDPDTTEPKAEADADASAQAPLGAQILEEFAKGFRGYLDRLAWRETRLCVSIDCSLFIVYWIQWMLQAALLGPLLGA